MQPGLVVCFGSGEIAPGAQRVYDLVLRELGSPIHISVLETPAGFELNSAQVAGRVADYIREHLQNYHPEVTVVPARKRGTPFSPDAPEIVAPLLQAKMIFMGPGSPTYAVRQLRGSLAWHTLIARHRLGAAIVLASAAVISIGACALPVYEIYKVGEDPHWKDGLDFFGPYGLSLTFVSHWDNNDGGEELDTSHCFMGKERFARLVEILPCDKKIVGIDEHTALVINLKERNCHVMGRGGVTIVTLEDERRFESEESFPMAELGPFQMPDPEAGLPLEVWGRALAAAAKSREEAVPEPPQEVLALVQERAAARKRRDWATADALRDRIANLGWQVLDTREGPRLEPL